MSDHVQRHLILSSASVKDALERLNTLASDAILFVVDEVRTLIGSLTDGDIRRGFLKGLSFDNSLLEFIQPRPAFLHLNEFDIALIDSYREKNLKVIPIINRDRAIVDVLNFRLKHSLLPLHVLIMAGGEGQRLRPLTLNTPKPMLKIGQKPIIEHNIDRLIQYGVSHITISLKYLGAQIKEYFGDGSSKGIRIDYIEETDSLGTIGALRMINDIHHDFVLVMNSDLLTTINFEDLFIHFTTENAELVVAAVPYHVKVPYAVLETDQNRILSLEEKPTYTYYSNAGIYLMKKEVATLIPAEGAYNATDLLESMIRTGRKVISYPLLDYWLDIGRPEDYQKAQEDIKHLNI